MHRMSSSLVDSRLDGRYCLQKAGNPTQATFAGAYPPSRGKSRTIQKNRLTIRSYSGRLLTLPSISTIEQLAFWPSGYGASFRQSEDTASGEIRVGSSPTEVNIFLFFSVDDSLMITAAD